MAQYTPWDYEEAKRYGTWSNNKGFYGWRDQANRWAEQQKGGPVQRLEQWASGFDPSQYTTKDEAKKLYEGRLNDIQKAFQQMQTEQDQKWSTWNARWEEANKPELLNVGGTEMPIGGVGDYINQMNQQWGNQYRQQDAYINQMNQQWGNQLNQQDQRWGNQLQQQDDYLHNMNQYWGNQLQQQDRRFYQQDEQNRNLRSQQDSLEAQLRDQQRSRTNEWASSRQDWNMYGGPRYGGGYGGSGYNNQLTIDNLNI